MLHKVPTTTYLVKSSSSRVPVCSGYSFLILNKPPKQAFTNAKYAWSTFSLTDNGEVCWIGKSCAYILIYLKNFFFKGSFFYFLLNFFIFLRFQRFLTVLISKFRIYGVVNELFTTFWRYDNGVFWTVFGGFAKNESISATLPTGFVIRSLKLTKKSLHH